MHEQDARALHLATQLFTIKYLLDHDGRLLEPGLFLPCLWILSKYNISLWIFINSRKSPTLNK
jgi:hypothetical protein